MSTHEPFLLKCACAEEVLTMFCLLCFRQKLELFEADVSELQTQLDKVQILQLLILTVLKAYTVCSSVVLLLSEP